MSDEQHNETARNREEAIAPIRRDRTAAPLAAASLPQQGRRLPVTAIVGGTLLVLLFGVFFALPRWVGQEDDRTQPAATGDSEAGQPAAADDGPPPLTPAEIEALRTRAEAVLADVLELDGVLKARSADVWGSDGFLRFDSVARDGDDAFLAEDFVTANARYDEALALGQALLERSDEIMSRALDAGDAALAAGNSDLALEQYGIVLAVDPENARALHGIARAEKLPEVLAGTRDADRARQSGDLEAARDGYRAVLAIDPEWAPAERALAEVTTAIANARFERQLSAGFAALSAEEYDAAIEAFTAALSLRPQSEAAREGLAQAEQGQKLDVIALAEIRALAFERRELWDQAIERYEAALETDPTLAFAVEGLARSRARADLDSKLENLLDNPRLLLDEDILVDAREILDEALVFAESGQRIAAQTERLNLLIEAATRPVTVQLQSDDRTEVTVYRVGELGAFVEKEIEVRPGTYTVIGSRSGFRDVRHTFTVLPGRTIDPVRVVCIEPI